LKIIQTILIMLGAFLLSSCATKQTPQQPLKLVPATSENFIGYWRINLIPNEKHKSQYKNENMGYSSPCQFFIHKPNGDWYNLTISNGAGDAESLRRCPNKKADIDLGMLALSMSKTSITWEKAKLQDGLFYVTDHSPNGKTLLWKADYVTVDVASEKTIGADLKKGDMFMQITKNQGGNNFAPVWPMVLRPVVE
jgi:hypothetical protein